MTETNLRAAYGEFVVLSTDAARELYRLALFGAQVLRSRDGGGGFRPGSADLVEFLSPMLSIDAGQTSATEILLEPSSGPFADHAELRRQSPSAVTSVEAAVRWDCEDTYVRRLCRAGRIPGATKDDAGAWQIPIEALSTPLSELPRVTSTKG
ncbi:MAG: hypothetical protein JO214_14590 [Frankiaceae bacterium]|nr:hypothetical protein [Frankiaceae bacterium]